MPRSAGPNQGPQDPGHCFRPRAGGGSARPVRSGCASSSPKRVSILRRAEFCKQEKRAWSSSPERVAIRPGKGTKIGKRHLRVPPKGAEPTLGLPREASSGRRLRRRVRAEQSEERFGSCPLRLASLPTQRPRARGRPSRISRSAARSSRRAASSTCSRCRLPRAASISVRSHSGGSSPRVTRASSRRSRARWSRASGSRSCRHAPRSITAPMTTAG
jgi:hypothetical protein